MTGRRKRVVIAVAVLALAAAAVLLRDPPPAATGAWMERAGVSPRFVDVDGQRIRYVRRGQGPAVVLLHGFASSIYTWADVIPSLSARFDVIAADLPGFGGSEIPLPGPAQAASLAAFVPGLLRQLGLDRASVAGNSFGGAVATLAAARHPALVDRLVLLDAAAYNFAPADRPRILRLLGSLPAALVESVPRRPLVRLGLRQVFYDDRLILQEKIEEYYAPIARPGAARFAQALLHGREDFGLPALVREVRAPTLVIWGRQDAWVPVAHADRFVSDIPGARKVVLEGCGHVPQEERPQEVARLIQGFLNDATAPQSHRATEK